MRLRMILACSCLLGLGAAAPLLGAAPASGASSLHGAASAGTSGSAASAAPGIPPGAEWAAWLNRDIEIRLQDLPQTYTCDDLWYKLHALLLAIGARQYMSVHPYNCGAGAPGGGRSPTIDLRFQTLRPVTGKQIRWANTRALEKTVEIGPGKPSRLDAGDCALVKQLAGTLFPYLDYRIESSHFDCSAPQGRGYGLSVHIIQRWPDTESADP